MDFISLPLFLSFPPHATGVCCGGALREGLQSLVPGSRVTCVVRASFDSGLAFVRTDRTRRFGGEPIARSLTGTVSHSFQGCCEACAKQRRRNEVGGQRRQWTRGAGNWSRQGSLGNPHVLRTVLSFWPLRPAAASAPTEFGCFPRANTGCPIPVCPPQPEV